MFNLNHKQYLKLGQVSKITIFALAQYRHGLNSLYSEAVYVFLHQVTTGYITDQILSVNIREQALSMDMGNSEDNALVQSNITNTVQIQRAVSDDLKKTKGKL